MKTRGFPQAHVAILQVIALLVISTASGAPDTWNDGTDSQWDTNANWSTGLKPTVGDDAIFPSVVPVSGSAIALGGGEVANTLTFNGNYSLVFGSLTLTTGTITENGLGSLIGTALTGAGSITKEGTGQILLSGTNTYLGGTTLNAGTLLAGSNSAFGTGTVTINGGTFGISTFSEVIANNITVNANFNMVSDAVLILNGTVDLAGGSRTITALSNGNGNNVRFQGVIQNGTGLTLAGTTLSAFNYTMAGAGSNTYTGTTTVDQAALSLEKSGGAIAVPGDLLVKNGGFVTFRATGQLAAATVITLDQGNLDTILDVTVPNNIVLAAGGGQMSENTGTTFTLTGLISGDGTLLQAGDFSTGGTLVITHSNTYTGGTSLSTGTLYADTNNALGTGGLTIQGGTTIGAHTPTITLPNAVTINGSFNVAPNNAFDFHGDVTLNTTPTITNTLGGGSEVFFSGAISGTHGITFAGQPDSNFRFSGTTSNTYTGLTTTGSNIFLNLSKSVANGAIPGDLLIESNSTVLLGASEQIADTSTVTDNSTGRSGGTSQGLELNNASETIGALLGNGTVGLGSGTLTVGAGNFSGVIADGANGAGGKLVKNTAGMVTLTNDNTYTGGTTINAGALAAGSLNSLGTGNVLVHGGTLQTFNGPRPIAVGGNYTQDSGGTLRLQLGGLDSGAESDYLTVNGSASLGGTLALVRINNFNPSAGDRVDIIGDLGGHSGVFSTVTSTFTGVLRPVPEYDEANDVYLLFQLFSFNIGGLTPNQKSVAHNLDNAANDPAAATLINFLQMEALGNLPHDYDLIAPEELASIYEIGFSQAMIQNDNLQRRMDDIRAGSNGFCANGFVPQVSGKDYTKDSDGKASLPDKTTRDVYTPSADNRWGVFVTGTGDFVNVGNDDFNARGYDITTGDFTVGADYRLCNNFAIGIDAGYSRSNADLVDDGRVDVDGGKVGAYATVFGKGLFGSKFYVDGTVGGGFNSYDTRRTGLQDVFVRGSTDGSEFNAMISYGSDWTFGCFNIGTWSSVQFTNVSIDQFTETGSLAPLIIQDQDENSFRSTTGLHASYDIKAGHMIFRPEVRAAYQHEYCDQAYQIDSQLASGAGGIFRVRGPSIGRDAALLGAGMSMQWNNRLSTYVYYDGVLGRNNYDNNAISGGFRIGF